MNIIICELIIQILDQADGGATGGRMARLRAMAMLALKTSSSGKSS